MQCIILALVREVLNWVYSNPLQDSLFARATAAPTVSSQASSTFISNMRLPVHRWFRYSAGFSAAWVESVINDARRSGAVRVLDPFAGSATTLLAAETAGVESWGIDAHPFVCRVAKAKLAWRTDPVLYWQKVEKVRELATTLTPDTSEYPKIIHTCFDEQSLAWLDTLRRAYELTRDETSASELIWLTIVGILRRVAKVGTAPWQYLLPKKTKSNPQQVGVAFNEFAAMVYHDMQTGQGLTGPRARFAEGDARDSLGMSSRANLVITWAICRRKCESTWCDLVRSTFPRRRLD